jgi:hypothetical protein
LLASRLPFRPGAVAMNAAAPLTLTTSLNRNMGTKVSAELVLDDSTGIEKIWKVNTDMTLGKGTEKVTFQTYENSIKAVTDLNKEIEDVRHTLGALINSRDDAAIALNALNTRALSAIRGIFGPDSTEYDQAGGTRTSERKKPVRKEKAEK